jgi:transcriptional regulator with XRE-family HTH domain
MELLVASHNGAFEGRGVDVLGLARVTGGDNLVTGGYTFRSTMPSLQLRAFTRRLRDWRVSHGFDQQRIAVHLGVSRKTYILLETSRWFPPHKERAHFILALSALDPTLVDAALELLGGELDDHVLRAAGDVSPLDAASTKAAVDDAIRAAADTMDVTARAFRPAASVLLARLAQSGVSVAQAAKASASS